MHRRLRGSDRKAVDVGFSDPFASLDVQIEPMTRLRQVLVRRIIAAIVAVSIGVFVGEPLFAEVHEGNAAGSSGSTAAAAADTAVSLVDLVHTQQGHDDGERPADDGHRVHVCHEAHTHAASLDPAELPPISRATRRQTVTATTARPASWSAAPRLRPPIG